MWMRTPLVCIYLSSVTKAFTTNTLLAASSPIAFHNTIQNAKRTIATTSTTMASASASSDNIGLTDIGGGGPTSTATSNDTITTWREKIKISSAKSRKVRGGNYVQIATVDPTTMEPRCRTVVFRGFVKQDGEETSIMKMITDKRSNKYSEVMNHSESSASTCTAEMVWWFGKSSEQYRIRGQLKFVGEDNTDKSLLIARKEQWGNMSDPAREQFYWKEPGIPYESDSVVPVGGRGEDGKVLPPPDNFLLMLLYPNRVDYLRLGDNFRQVDDLVNDEWVANRVNP